MKAIIGISALIALLALTSVNCEISSSSSLESSIETSRMPEKQWADYKLQHNKEYPEEEDKKRFQIFKDALKRIEEHNAKYARGETTYTMGLNHMTDWTDEERSRTMGLISRPEQKN